MDLLRILALEPEDIGVISAHMQDAIIRVADISYGVKTRHFTLVANRFETENSALLENNSQAGFRRQTGLSFSQVKTVRSRKIRQNAGSAVLSLLAIEFAPGPTAPDGVIKLIFSGDGSIELDVECVEVQLEDLGPRWPTTNIPAHELDDEQE